MTTTKAAPAGGPASTTIACPYCAADMPAGHFVAWAREPRLTTGICGGCSRSVTLPSLWLAHPRTTGHLAL
jgi:hypothetical protein